MRMEIVQISDIFVAVCRARLVVGVLLMKGISDEVEAVYFPMVDAESEGFFACEHRFISAVLKFMHRSVLTEHQP